jgi:putative copper export protein
LAAIVLVTLYSLTKDNKWKTILGVILSLLLLISLAMSGHQGTKGYLTIPFFLDIFHLIGISLWIGGIFFIRLCYSFFLTVADASLWDTFLTLINRFSQLATISVVIVGVTGLALFISYFESLSGIIATKYGLLLLLKLTLAVLIVVLGGINKFFFLPEFNKAKKEELLKLTSLRKRFNSFVTMEVCVGIVILLTTSILTHLSPMK